MSVEGTEAEGGVVTITQSSNITIASVVFRDTDYTLESYGTDGWVVDSCVLFKIEPGTTDEVFPNFLEGEEHNHQ